MALAIMHLHRPGTVNEQVPNIWRQFVTPIINPLKNQQQLTLPVTVVIICCIVGSPALKSPAKYVSSVFDLGQSGLIEQVHVVPGAESIQIPCQLHVMSTIPAYFPCLPRGICVVAGLLLFILSGFCTEHRHYKELLLLCLPHHLNG